jgi:hypothetical protein
VIDTIEIEHGFGKGALDVSFSIERSLKPEPNTAEIRVWNLNADHRSQLEEIKTEKTKTSTGQQVPVLIEAGYEGGYTQLFSGTMRTAFTVREGADLVTTLQSGDGEKEYNRRRINLSIAKATPNASVLQQVVKALGVGEGNLATVTPALAAVPLLFPQGGVLSGSASQILTRITQSLGFEWSIQEGTLQILQARAPLSVSATLLSSDTGLVGAPSIDNEGVLTARCLLIPDVFPGRLLVLESERLSGNFRVEKCNYSGNTAGTEWYIDLEAKKL